KAAISSLQLDIDRHVRRNSDRIDKRTFRPNRNCPIESPQQALIGAALFKLRERHARRQPRQTVGSRNDVAVGLVGAGNHKTAAIAYPQDSAARTVQVQLPFRHLLGPTTHMISSMGRTPRATPFPCPKAKDRKLGPCYPLPR